jgi:predicted HAD superfamily Cof-like phosphohydrolase
MTTKLTRRVVRETSVREQGGRPLMIELVEGGRLLRVWPKGRRQRYTVTIEQLYVQGWKNKAADERAARDEARRARRAARRR